MKPTKKSKSRLICTCNKVSQDTIESFIRRGCKTLPAIFGATTAGVGQCGGSCRPTLDKMLQSFLDKGSFPENPIVNVPEEKKEKK